MNGVRRALLLVTVNRYFSMCVNFVQIALLSRLLTPAEIGVSVIGVAVTALSMSIREFGSLAYLIQKPDITEADKRTGATISMLFGITIATFCFIAAPFIERIYHTPGVTLYLSLCGLALLIESFNIPLVALMKRDFEFGKTIMVDMANVVVGGVSICVLAWQGFSFMSFGWGWVIGASAATLMAFVLRPEFSTYVPTLREWRAPMSFGFYNGLASLLNRAYDSAPLLLLGRTMGLQATGHFYRALNLCQLPDKMFLAGAMQVALPALSRAVAEGRDVKDAYLRGAAQITALYWPALAMLALLAHPITDLLLGPQWTDVAPLIQIIAIAWMAAFSNDLTYSLLVSLGGIRDNLWRNSIMWPVSGAILIGASFWGVQAAALSMLIAVPFQWLVSFLMVRKYLPISFAEFGRAVAPSAVATLATVGGPLAVVAVFMGGDLRMTLLQAVGLGALSGVCWFAALVLTRHALWGEIKMLLNRARGLAIG